MKAGRGEKEEQVKRFWDMTEKEVEAAGGNMGVDKWREKVREDRDHAAEELASGPNPWAASTFSEKRQVMIRSLAPEVAETMQRKAEAH
jgi:hypothetical protein